MTPKVDCHLHTNFSPDGFFPPEEVIKNAISLGIEHICITDHVDFLYSDPSFKAFDINEYLTVLRALKQKYADKIFINVGVEVGYTRENYLINDAELKKNHFDYVISSIHEVNGSDCYYAKHFEGRDRDTVYSDYFNAVLESICVPYKVHAVGHLAYISRTAPYADKQIAKGEFDGILTKIFQKMIKDNIILELNTNVYTAGSLSLPALPILEKYRDMGGKLLCFSSDAHKLERMAQNYDPIVKMCQSLGYTKWAIIQNDTLKTVAF